jgi:hypothetical protein
MQYRVGALSEVTLGPTNPLVLRHCSAADLGGNRLHFRPTANRARSDIFSSMAPFPDERPSNPVYIMAVTRLSCPDSRTVSDFLDRHLEALQALLVQVLQLCQGASLVEFAPSRGRQHQG